jgi:lipoyl-dependent peroxiredoxin
MESKIYRRSAEAKWTGTLKEGEGTVSTESQTIKSAKLAFNYRFGDQPGTNPEELIAAAHASCFSMAFANEMKKLDLNPHEIRTRATVDLENTNGSFAVTKSHLTVETTVTGPEDRVKIAGETAKTNCPISKLLRAQVTLELNVYSPAKAEEMSA